MASRPGPIGEQRGQPDAHARLSKFLLQSQRLNQPIGLQEFSARRQFARRTWAAARFAARSSLRAQLGRVVRGGVAGTVGRRCGEGPATSSRSITQGKGRGHNASCGCRSVAPFPVCLTSNLRSLIRTLKRHLYLFSSKKNPLVLDGRLQRYHQQSTERSCVLRFEPIGRRFRDERSQRIQLPSLT